MAEPCLWIKASELERTDATKGRTMDFLDDVGTPLAHPGSVTPTQTSGSWLKTGAPRDC
jgi:hypothetical protein